MKPRWIIQTVVLGLVGMVFAGCVVFEPVPNDPLDGTSWVLVSLEGEDPLGGISITASFDAGSLHGSSGCNNYGASYEIDGDRIEVREIESTLMACIDPRGASDQEQKFIALLGSSQSYQIADGQLRLLRSNRELLSFVPSD